MCKRRKELPRKANSYISRSAEGREDISFIKSMYARGGNNQGQCSQFEKEERHGSFRCFVNNDHLRDVVAGGSVAFPVLLI